MKLSWIDILPEFIRHKLDGREVLQKTIVNTGWLFADHILRMGVGFFVIIWVARYLGPEQFGIYNYAIAFVALFSAFATLGLDGIVVRNIVRDPLRKGETLGTAFTLKIISGLVTLLLTMLSIYLLRPHDSLTRWMVGIIAAGFIFQAFDAIDFYFQSQIQSKYSVIAKNSAFLIVSILKIVLILLNAPLIAFAWAGFAEIILGAFGLIILYRVQGHFLNFWNVNLKQIKSLLRDSWPLILSGLAVMMYVRIDQIMLGEMIGDKAVGVYSAATRISEASYFIPVAITRSVFPSIIEAKKISEHLYIDRLQSLYDLMTWLGIIIAVIISFWAGDIIRILFGNQYAASGTVLSLHIWSSIFVFLGLASGQFLMTENLTKIAFYRTLSGAITNVLLNIYLIPKYGVVGAAVATVLSYFIATFAIVINKESRINLRLFLYTLNIGRIIRRMHNILSK